MNHGNVEPLGNQDGAPTERWDFLENEPEACAIFSGKMEILYLNAVARPLVPPNWLGRRCWEMFPVGEANCASRCPAVRAVRAADDMVYCEETLYPGGNLLVIGVVVLPVENGSSSRGQALILLRPRPETSCQEVFREECLRKARELLTRVKAARGRRA